MVLNCNPDGHFLEYKFNREIARRIVLDLQDRGYDAELLVPEETDIPLKERANRVNSHCAALGKENVILVSIHANAAGNGSKWLNATGWSVYTSKGHTKSDNLAACLTENGFMTNLSDVSFLQSLSGMEAITMLHVEGICDYLAR